MDIYLTLFKLFAVLIGFLVIAYVLAAVAVAIVLGTLETLRQAWELEEKASNNGQGGSDENLG
jgi:hypothetical protein